MEYDFSWWVVPGVVLYFIVAIICFGLYTETKAKWWMVAIVAVIGIAGVNTLTYGVSSGTPADSPQVYAPDIAAAGFGLESGKPYQLLLGDRMGNSTTVVYRGGLFSRPRYIVAGTTASSTLSMDFTHEGASYILELPVANIKFTQDLAAVDPTVTIYLNSGQGFGQQELASEGPCSVIVQSVYLACSRELVWETRVSEGTKNAGLPKLVSEHLDRVEITLTPAAYQAILGVRQSE